MRVLEAIGYIIMAGIMLGVVLTAVWILLTAFRSDLDFEDEDDRDIYERQYWEKKNKNKKT